MIIDRLEHGSGLIHFSLEGHRLPSSFGIDLLGLDHLLHQVETEIQWQASPTGLHPLQQADSDNALSPRITLLIVLGGMIMEKATTKDLPASLGIDGVI